jgi:ATP-dependent Clp protease protease subunit
MPKNPLVALVAALSLPASSHLASAQEVSNNPPAEVTSSPSVELAALPPKPVDSSQTTAPAQLAGQEPTEIQNTTSPQGSTPSIAGNDGPGSNTSAMRAEQERLTLENSLANDRINRELSEFRAEIQRMRMEREAINERLSLDDARRRADSYAGLAEARQQTSDLMRDAELAKARAEKLTNELKTIEATSGIQISKLQTEIAQLEAQAKRAQYADSTPVYLDNPLREDGTLVISDRRIALNGAITPATADFVTDRISYFNNKDASKPIFIVIDDSPGGSVMAGYRILKSMEGSRAPIHVVVKSFAASMAATIATLAQSSYAYPNAVILHHQISATLFMAKLNLTQQKEFYEESTRWWTRLAEPIAKKMGISTEELIKRMYARSTSGDWSEFADEAVKLKWIDHLVTAIDETSMVKSPDLIPATPQEKATAINGVAEAADEEGRPAMFLPRLNPKDVYFMYNPDQYYRLR